MFSKYKSMQDLKRLSAKAFDLTSLTPQRMNDLKTQNVGWELLYASERIDEEILSSLFALAHEAKAVEAMTQMQEGKIVNQIEGFASEKRAALHTATRDFFKNPILTKEAEVVRKEAYKEVEKLEAFVQSFEDKECSDLILIGIGGSSLGPKALYFALAAYQKRSIRVHFLSTIDPDQSSTILRQVSLDKTFVLSISKSGSTLETLANEARIREAYKKKGLDPQKYLIAITSKQSPMDDPSRYLSIFYLWDSIGGRYSSTSMVGGVFLSLALGFDVYWELLEGAHAMDLVARSSYDCKNLPLLGALFEVWNRNFLRHPALCVVPYSQALCYFPAHLQQLEMESNGKRIDKKGNAVDFATAPLLFGEIGTDCQHSFFQWLHQGTDLVSLEFIGAVKSQYGEDFLWEGTLFQEKLLSNLFAQSISLSIGKKEENPNKIFPGNRPNHILLTEILDPYRVGALLSYYEHKTVFQGFIWNINSFDQEGVELGKKMAQELVEQFRAKRDSSVRVASFPLGEAYVEQVEDFL